MIATVLIRCALVARLVAKVAVLGEESKDTRERLAHLEGHVCGAPEDPNGDEDEVDDQDGDDDEPPAPTRRPGSAPNPLGLDVN